MCSSLYAYALVSGRECSVQCAHGPFRQLSSNDGYSHSLRLSRRDTSTFYAVEIGVRILVAQFEPFQQVLLFVWRATAFNQKLQAIPGRDRRVRKYTYTLE